MPLKKSKSQKEINDIYDKAAEVLAEHNSVYAKTQKVLFDLFTKGVAYNDPVTHQRKVCDESLAGGDKRVIAETVFGEGKQTIGECDRYPGAATQGMVWFCLSKGITTEDLYELGKNPDSEQSIALKNQIAGMKQEYHDIITSNDHETLSDFFVSCFQRFEKYSKSYLKAGSMEGLQTEWKKLMFWCGAGALIQQSWENCNNLTKTTELQKQFINRVQEKMQNLWGPSASVKGVTCVMNLIHATTNRFVGASIDSDIPIDDGDESAADKATKKRRAIANSIISFKIVHDHLNKEFSEGRVTNFFAEKTGKAAAIGERDYTAMLPDNEILKKLINFEMRNLAIGDRVCLYNPDHVCDYENSAPNSKTTVQPTWDGINNFFDGDKLMEFMEKLDWDKEDAFADLTQTITQKAKNHENLTGLEIGLFMTEESCFGEAEQEIYDQFMGKSDMLRFSEIPITMQGILGTISRTQLGVEPEVYVSKANVVKNKCDASFLKTVSDIRTQKSEDLINTDDNEAMLEKLRTSLEEVDVTIASSSEFKNLASAFRKVDKSADQIRGHEEQYKNDMKALAEAAKVYIQAKNKGDNTKERFTDKGQKRLNLARRLEAFGNATVEGIEKTTEAPEKVKVQEYINDGPEAAAFEEKNQPALNIPVNTGYHI